MSAPDQRGYDPRFNGDAPRRGPNHRPYPPLDEFGRPYGQPYGPPTGYGPPPGRGPAFRDEPPNGHRPPPRFDEHPSFAPRDVPGPPPGGTVGPYGWEPPRDVPRGYPHDSVRPDDRRWGAPPPEPHVEAPFRGEYPSPSRVGMGAEPRWEPTPHRAAPPAYEGWDRPAPAAYEPAAHRDVAPLRDQWGEPRLPHEAWDRPAPTHFPRPATPQGPPPPWADSHDDAPAWGPPTHQRGWDVPPRGFPAPEMRGYPPSDAPATGYRGPSYAPPTPEPPYGRSGYDVGYAPPTYDAPPFNPPSVGRPPYDPGYDQHGYDTGYDQHGYDTGYERRGHETGGYDVESYDDGRFGPPSHGYAAPSEPRYGYEPEPPSYEQLTYEPDIEEQAPAGPPPPPPAVVTSGGYMLVKELMVVVTLALVLALVSKTWVMQAFSIPSQSMMSTLKIGDRVTVSKINPGPFNLQRGDIVVFKDPANWLKDAKDKKQAADAKRNAFTIAMETGLQWTGLMPPDDNDHVIKRLIGLPGDLVECEGGGKPLKVNGQPVSETYLDKGKQPSEMAFSVVIPPGRVWVMGDNRNHSGDSRFNDTKHNLKEGPSTPGFAYPGTGLRALPEDDPKDFTGFYGSVPVDKIVGRGFALVWPLSNMRWFGGEHDVFAKVPSPRPGAKPNPALRPAKQPNQGTPPPAGQSSADAGPNGTGQGSAGAPSPTPSTSRT